MLCELVGKRKLAEKIYDFTVQCPEMAKNARTGQFLHILCGGEAYLRRPISICDVVDKRYIRFVFEVKGVGTDALAKYELGSRLDILGPLGNGFELHPEDKNAVLLIGGGIGVFPLLFLAKQMKGRATVLLGFRNKQSVIMADEFATVSRNVFLATDDGSFGYHGFVTDVLKNILSSNPVSRIYTCGPAPMMKLVCQIAGENALPVQASLEERMGCGIGACVTCTCTVGGQRKRVCKDGPVFDGAEVEWNG
ncbi:dihydroorotate dehydrogenase electron transfer subunit [Ructibacterium gallinarum]|uniref:Dihydroorotate dehydrogenase B (NAD(+)), electron transfer subunit n=1 Tax=Ructibacterium gallinarum TaxID=2779355 RepID=A0A9D5M295_9FIRM|nr:dihydroorotate dehydrogenase electron transfer subunit [Ructibacterium gallinarum]MBE5040980.1 dihydroorotate dehydrogenase electron transfer subunit [Ructibacterium gallinarum]